MNLPELHGCDTVIVMGPVSSGKTWLLGQWLRGMERATLIDSTAAFLSEPDFSHVWANPVQLGNLLKQNSYYYRIAYHPRNLTKDFEWVCHAMWQVERPRWLVMDEVQRVIGDSLSPMGELVCQISRHNDLGFIGAAQRIAEVSKTMTAAARMAILFHTTEDNDLEAIRKRYGSNVRDAVLSLRPCMYNDATKDVEQHPECVIWRLGMGFRVIPLGTKIKSQGDKELWQGHGKEALAKPEAPSSEPDSGSPEPSLTESSSEHS